MVNQLCYLFLIKNKSKSFNSGSDKKKIKNKNHANTISCYQEIFNTDTNTDNTISRYKCLNCDKVNYNKDLYCDIDCKTSFEFKEKEKVEKELKNK